jgi:hypothetical protein
VDIEAAPADAVLLPSGVAPSKKVTRPPALGLPPELETVAVRVSGAPSVDGFADVASATVAEVVMGSRLVIAKVADSPGAVAITE